MDTTTLEVQTRVGDVKPKELLAKNFIPAVYYGKGIENQNLQVDYQTFRRLFRAAGSNTIIDLNIDGGKKAKVLVHEISKHPVTDQITHIDFINVRMDQELHTEIPVVLFGTAAVVKELGGVIMHTLTELKVKCLPKDLVHDIQVSIEPLTDFHISIRVGDLVLPPGITVLNGPEEVIVTGIAPKVEEEAPIAEAAATDAAAGDAAAAPATDQKAE